MSFYATKLDYLLARREKLLWEMEDFGKRGLTSAAASAKGILQRYVEPAIKEESEASLRPKKPVAKSANEEWGGF